MPPVQNRLPRPPTILEEQQAAFAPTRGIRFIAGRDIAALEPKNVLSPKGRRKLRRQGISLDEPLSLAELSQVENIDARDFGKRFRKDLRDAGVLRGPGFAAPTFLAELLGGEGGFAPTTGEEAGPRPVDTALRELETGALDLITGGQALATGDFESPFAQDFLRNFEERFNTPLAGRGLARSGEAEFQRVLGGETALRSVGLQQVGAGLGQLQVANPFAFPSFGLERSDIQFGRQTSQDLLEVQRKLNQAAVRRLTNFGNQLEGSLAQTLVPGLFGLGGAAIGAFGGRSQPPQQQGLLSLLGVT